jgi:hypothetical protein
MFGKFFGKAPAKPGPKPAPVAPTGEALREELKELSYPDVLALLQRFMDGELEWTDARDILAFVECLIDRRYYDRSITEDSRLSADTLIDVLTNALEQVNNPQFVESARAAWTHQREIGEQQGCHTLFGAFRELPYDDALALAVRPGRARQLADLLAAAPDLAATLVPDVIRTLVKDRVPSRWESEIPGSLHNIWRVSNVVLVLGWLLRMRDPTAEALLTDDDQDHLWNCLGDYDNARRPLLELGLVTGRSPRLTADLEHDKDQLAGFMSGVMGHPDPAFTAIALGDRAGAWDALPREVREAVGTSLRLLRLYIFREVLKNVLPEAAVGTVVEAAFNGGVPEPVVAALERLAFTEKMVRERAIPAEPDMGFPPGLDILTMVEIRDDFDDETLTEATRNERMNLIREIIRDEWLLAASSSRFMMHAALSGGARVEPYEDLIS